MRAILAGGTPDSTKVRSAKLEGTTIRSQRSYSSSSLSMIQGSTGSGSRPQRRLSSARSELCTTMCDEPRSHTVKAPYLFLAAAWLRRPKPERQWKTVHGASRDDIQRSKVSITQRFRRWLAAWTPALVRAVVGAISHGKVLV